MLHMCVRQRLLGALATCAAVRRAPVSTGDAVAVAIANAATNCIADCGTHAAAHGDADTCV